MVDVWYCGEKAEKSSKFRICDKVPERTLVLEIRIFQYNIL